MFFPILSAFFAAGLSFSLASPLAVPQRRDTSTACAGAPGGWLVNANNITLLAYNTTGDTSVGAPLHVPVIQQYHEAESLLLALASSEPYTDDPYLSLVNGSLLAYPQSGNTGKPAAAKTPQPGTELGLVKPLPAQPDQTFCAVIEERQPLLAVNGDADSWALCRSSSNLVGSYPYFVVYKPTASNDGSYVFEDCYSIKLGVEFPPTTSV